MYVLECTLQQGKNITKWKSRAWVGAFMVFLPHQSSLVPLFLNLVTGKISPQYHVIFDDKFKTVDFLHPSVKDIDNQWGTLYGLHGEGSNFYLDQEFDTNGNSMIQ